MVQDAVRIMVVLVVVQWPMSLYQGGLMGLQRQTVTNAVSILSSTLRYGGAALVLLFLSPTITAFFEWQVVVAVVQALVIMVLLWHFMPVSGQRTRFRPQMIRSIGGFATGLGGITVTAIIITNIDKVILARILNLTEFGYYILGVQVAGSLVLLKTPIFNAVFPRMCQLAAAQDETGLHRLYHGSSQLMASLLIPAGAVMSLFAYQLMLLWMGDAVAAAHVSPLVALLAVGATVNGLMNTTYALQLAHGWVGLALAINVVWVVVLVPSVAFMSQRFGGLGAAGVSVGLNALYMLAAIPLTLRRLPRGETKRWFFGDTLPPLAAALGVVGIGRYLRDGDGKTLDAFGRLILIAASAVAASGLASPLVRVRVASLIGRHRTKGS
jgi:O-antigen/teichoic acid export membrane protein